MGVTHKAAAIWPFRAGPLAAGGVVWVEGASFVASLGTDSGASLDRGPSLYVSRSYMLSRT
jgi:hypothetical protein